MKLLNYFKSLLKKTEKTSFLGVSVARILEIEKHPNADRLNIVKLLTKKGGLTVVCGADNIEVGQLVPLASVGCKLPSGMEIKEAEIRGVKSFGMLCAADELGLGDDHSGILLLPEKAKIGYNIDKYIIK
jgi:phenylalanyl-tRNA synthetase beta chain